MRFQAKRGAFVREAAACAVLERQDPDAVRKLIAQARVSVRRTKCPERNDVICDLTESAGLEDAVSEQQDPPTVHKLIAQARFTRPLESPNPLESSQTLP